MDKENKNIQEWNSNFFIWEIFALNNQPNTNYKISEEVSINDNSNGTISATVVTYHISEATGNKLKTNSQIIIFQRCLIGQVYRSTQNDCEGTGTKATIWGAQKQQWCITNSSACQDSKNVAVVGLSPAATACSNSNLLSKTWALPGGFRSNTNDFIQEYMEYLVYNYSSNNLAKAILEDYISQTGNITFALWTNSGSVSNSTPYYATVAFYNDTDTLASFQPVTNSLNIICKEVMK
jgi:hypothetical protein